MVGDVENGDSHASFVLLPAKRNRQPFCDQHIQCKQLRKSPAAVARANVILSLIQQRKRKATTPLNDRSGDDVVRQSKVAPEQHTVRYVKRLAAIFIWSYHRVTKIPEVMVVVVEISTGR